MGISAVSSQLMKCLLSLYNVQSSPEPYFIIMSILIIIIADSQLFLNSKTNLKLALFLATDDMVVYPMYRKSYHWKFDSKRSQGNPQDKNIIKWY